MRCQNQHPPSQLNSDYSISDKNFHSSLEGRAFSPDPEPEPQLESDNVVDQSPTASRHPLPVLPPRMKDSVLLSQESKYFTESVPSTPHKPAIQIHEVGLEFEKEDTKEGENGEMRSRGKQDNEFESDED